MIQREPVPIRRPGFSLRRRILVIAGVLLLVLLVSVQRIAVFWTDYLWFDSVGFASVWRTLILSRVFLALIAAAVAILLLFANLVLADRLSPRTRLGTGGPDDELLGRYQDWVEPRILRFRLIVSGAFGLVIGLGAGSWWEDWLLFANSKSFGQSDLVFGNDIGFYVFEVPFLRDLFGWGFQFFLITTLIVAAIHYLNGGIQVQPGSVRVSPGVKVHLSVLLAVLAVLKAFAYWLDRFDLLYSTRGAVFGATYTDVNAQLPAKNLLLFISLFAAVLLLVNIRIRGWTLPIIAVGLWLATSVIVGLIIPTAVQRFSVQPDEINKELEFVGRHIDATRDAYGLSAVEVQDFAADDALTATELTANASTIDNIRLWDPSVLLTTYRQLQELRLFYQFTDVDVDRYVVDGELTQVMLAARELDEGGLPGTEWVNRHLVYTHGFGAVVSPANTVTVEGQPDFLVSDIAVDDPGGPPFDLAQQRIYFGEPLNSDNFVIVGSKEREVDFPVEDTESGAGAGENCEGGLCFNSYDGAGGVEMGSFFRRLAFTLRFGDINTLISGQITGESRVIMYRNLRDRITKAAPFLRADADPYLVVLDGRFVWVQDLYTVTDRYPYSEPATTGRLHPERSGLPNEFNYIRNSVKATVDAYDGTITFYVWDETDPVIRAYRDIFPALFTDKSEMPVGLLDHLRYPEDLFRVQSDMYTRYHVTDSRVFFTGTDPWQIARDPSTTRAEQTRAAFPSDNRPMVPYYLLMRLPEEQDLSYLVLQPFTAENRPNMVSFLIAKSDPDEYGRLVDYELPRDSFVDGPGQVGARINQNPEISREFTLLGQEGSEVIQGNMLVVPIEESIVYVQPIYISARQTEGAGGDVSALPEFKKAVVVFGDTIVMRDTLSEALVAAFGDAPPVVDDGDGPPDDGGEPPDDGGGVPDDVEAAVLQLLVEADAAFSRAEEALRNGDLAGYQTAVEEAQSAIDRARQLAEGVTTEG